jgi:hypothetical protein
MIKTAPTRRVHTSTCMPTSAVSTAVSSAFSLLHITATQSWYRSLCMHECALLAAALSLYIASTALQMLAAAGTVLAAATVATGSATCCCRCCYCYRCYDHSCMPSHSAACVQPTHMYIVNSVQLALREILATLKAIYQGPATLYIATLYMLLHTVATIELLQIHLP